MKINLSDRLKAKGWTKKDTNKVNRILKEAEKKKPSKIKLLDSFIYWFVLMVTIFGNLVISIALVPFLLELNNILLYGVIVLLALVFGTLFDLLIKDIESIEKKHIVIAGIFIPALAIINVFYITKFANFVSGKWGLGVEHNPFIIAIFYVIPFILPHMISVLIHKEVYY